MALGLARRKNTKEKGDANASNSLVMKVMKRDHSNTRVLGLIVLFFLVTVSSTMGQWKMDGDKPSDTPDRKSLNGFGAHLVPVKDPRAFIQEWLKPETPKIKSATKTKSGESLGILVFFAGCKEVDGACSSEVDYTIYKPDGTIFVERKAQPLWKEAAPPKSNIQLGRAILSFAFPKGQPSGKYRITAKVKDINADITLDLETHLELKD